MRYWLASIPSETYSTVKLWRMPRGMLEFVLKYGGLSGDALMRVCAEIKNMLGDLTPQNPANKQLIKATNDASETLQFVGQLSEKRKAVYALAYNQQLGAGEKPFVVSACQPLGSGASEFITHLFDLSQEDWAWVLDEQNMKRPGDWMGFEEAVRMMLGLACALHVDLEWEPQEDERMIRSALAKRMFFKAMERIREEERARGWGREMDVEAAWEGMKVAAAPASPDFRDVSRAVRTCAGRCAGTSRDCRIGCILKAVAVIQQLYQRECCRNFVSNAAPGPSGSESG